MDKVGISTCGKTPDAELFRSCRAAGIDYAELSMAYDAYPAADYTGIVQAAAQAGVTLWSMHLPFGPFDRLDISSADETLRAGSVAYLTELMERTGPLGFHKFIVHPSGEPIADEERPARMAAARQSLTQLAEAAAAVGAVVAVENLPRTCLGKNSDEILELLSADDRLRVCFDTNHLLAENAVEFIRKVGGKIITTHVSDYDLVDEKHWLPGEGKCPWNALLQELQAVGYTGPWLYELGFKAPATQPRSRDLTCEDFRRNADELFAGKTPTVIK